jgi:hypothetical protein
MDWLQEHTPELTEEEHDNLLKSYQEQRISKHFEAMEPYAQVYPYFRGDQTTGAEWCGECGKLIHKPVCVDGGNYIEGQWYPTVETNEFICERHAQERRNRDHRNALYERAESLERKLVKIYNQLNSVDNPEELLEEQREARRMLNRIYKRIEKSEAAEMLLEELKDLDDSKTYL